MTTERQTKPRRLLRFFGRSVLIAAALLSAGLIWLFNADLGFLKPRVEMLLSEQTGRAVKIERLEIRLGSQTSIRARGITVSNPSWAQQPVLLAVGALDTAIDLRSFFGETPVVEALAIGDVQLWLEESAAGERTWQLERPSKEAAGTGPAIPRLRHLSLRALRADYLTPRREEPLRVAIAEARQSLEADDFLAVVIDAAIGAEQDVAASARIGPWPSILAGSDVDFEFEAGLGGVDVAAEGRIDDLLRPSRPSLSFSIFGPDINELSRMFSLGVFEEGSIDLQGTLGAATGEDLTLTVAGNLGQSMIDASGRASDLARLDEAELQLEARGPSLAHFLRFGGIVLGEDGPFDVAIEARRSGKRLDIDEASLRFGETVAEATAILPNLPSLEDAQATMALEGPRIELLRDLLRLPPALAGPFDVTGRIAAPPGAREHIELEAVTNLGSVSIEGKLGPGPSHFDTEGRIAILSDDLEQLGEAFRIRKLPAGPLSASGPFRYGPDGITFEQPLTISIGEIDASATGSLALADGVRLALAVDLAGPDFTPLARVFRLPPWLPPLPFSIPGTVTFENRTLGFTAKDAKLGRSMLSATGRLTPRAGGVDLDLDLAASGTAIEELLAVRGGRLSPRPGPYDLSGRLELRSGEIRINNLVVERPRGTVTMTFGIALPATLRRISFDVVGQGQDITAIVQTVGPVRFDPEPYRLAIEGLRESGDWRFDRLELDLADARLRASGLLDLNDDLASTQLAVEASIPDLSALSLETGQAFRPWPFAISGHVDGTAESLAIDDLSILLGESDLTGQVRFRRGDVPRIDADLRSQVLRLASPLQAVTPDRSTDEPPAADGRLLPETALPVEFLERIDGALDMHVTALRWGEADLANFALDAGIEGGILDVGRLAFDGERGSVQLRAHSRPDGERRIHSLDLSAVELGVPIRNWNDDLSTRIDLELALDSSGLTLAEILADASGMVFFHASGGRIPDWRILDNLYGNLFEQLFRRINPFRDSPEPADLECVVTPVEIADGVLTSAPSSLLSTSQLRMTTNSRINLENEAIDISIRSTPRRALGVSAGELINPFIRLRGTLAKPKLAVDESGALLTGGAAVATAGLSLFAKAAWDRLARSRDPCRDAVKLGRERLSDRFPRWDEPPAR